METFGPTQFGAILLEAANGAMPWIAGGAAAGAILLAVGIGLNKGIGALRTVGSTKTKV